MFKNPPQIYAHISALKNGHLILENGILMKHEDTVCLKSRDCPHRGYLIQETGEVVKTVVCKLHGFAWNNEGQPLTQKPYCDHFYKLQHTADLTVSRSGLITKNFKDDNSQWMQDLMSQTDLEYDRIIKGESAGSYLWMMEQLADILHLRQDGVHPRQSLETPIDKDHLTQYEGEDYVVQRYTNVNGTSGYWVWHYPGFGIEFEPGKLIIYRIIPKDPDEEFGFYWELQFYYSPWVDSNERKEWDKAIEVYKEDLEVVDRIRHPFFPLKKISNEKENQMYHWGQWYLKNKK
jgi:nitrite reductase/ring-hydroxylating ferredoxin subunit